MPKGQRIALFGLAALTAVVAVVALRPRADSTDNTAGAPTTEHPLDQRGITPDGRDATDGLQDTRTGTPANQPRPKPPLLRAGSERTLSFEKGQTVRFRVRHPSGDEVHVHGYDVSKDIPAGKTVTVSFPADIEGIFEMELELSGTPLGRLKVEP